MLKGEPQERPLQKTKRSTNQFQRQVRLSKGAGEPPHE